MTRPNSPHQGLTDSFGPGASDLSKVIRLVWVSPLPAMFLLLVLVVHGYRDGGMLRTCATPHGTLVSHQAPQLGVAEVRRSKSSGLQRPHRSRSRTERVRCAFHYGVISQREVSSVDSDGRHVVESRPNKEEEVALVCIVQMSG